ncbi:YraN family protein [Candidatus Glomeribacter gigasporarum]|nr:YraN family protein [Candidatus Glomeribacter gigasporarum]
MICNTHVKGASFETRALHYLQARALKCVARNVRFRCGEIDLVMRDASSVLVFVEVRARAGSHYGGALASIDQAKRARIQRAAHAYLSGWRGPLPACRFDTVTFDGAQVVWLRNAFSADTV